MANRSKNKWESCLGLALLTGLCLIISASPGFAQDVPAVEVGQRARITLESLSHEVEGYPPRQIVRGTLLAVGRDSIAVAIHPGATPLAVSWSAVERIDISGGVRSRGGSAVRRGLEMALIGAVQALISNSLDDDPNFDENWQAAALGAGVGAVVGMVWGALRPWEIWNRVE